MAREEPVLNLKSTIMKTPMVALVGILLLLNSCVFEAPFESEAKVPVLPGLLGCWELIRDDGSKQAPERMLVLQHSANEYAVQYPVGEDGMFFRAIGVELSGGDYMQVQLIGTSKGPVKAADRKYHLLKLKLDGDQLEMRTINPEVLGDVRNDTAKLRAAFAKHKDDPDLFEESGKFHRIK